MSAHTIFVTNLERRRRDAGMTKSDVIARSQLGATTFFEILRGDTSPTLQTLEALAQAVGAPLCEMFAPPPPPGHRTVVVALPPERAFVAERWEEEARSALRRK